MTDRPERGASGHQDEPDEIRQARSLSAADCIRRKMNRRRSRNTGPPSECPDLCTIVSLYAGRRSQTASSEATSDFGRPRPFVAAVT